MGRERQRERETDRQTDRQRGWGGGGEDRYGEEGDTCSLERRSIF